VNDLKGSVQGVVCDGSGKPGFYALATTTGHTWIKLSKKLPPLTLGTQLQVEGRWKSTAAGDPYLKVKKLLPETLTVQVCTKGSCRKGGACQLLAQLHTVHPTWQVEEVGCLGVCQSAKHGANVRLGGRLHRGVKQAADISPVHSEG
jgi:hypothetical protein